MNKKTKIVIGVIVFIGVAVWAYFMAARAYEFSNQDIGYADTNSEADVSNVPDDLLAASSGAMCHNKNYRATHKECQGHKSFGQFLLFVTTGITR